MFTRILFKAPWVWFSPDEASWFGNKTTSKWNCNLSYLWLIRRIMQIFNSKHDKIKRRANISDKECRNRSSWTESADKDMNGSKGELYTNHTHTPLTACSPTSLYILAQGCTVMQKGESNSLANVQSVVCILQWAFSVDTHICRQCRGKQYSTVQYLGKLCNCVCTQCTVHSSGTIASTTHCDIIQFKMNLQSCNQ